MRTESLVQPIVTSNKILMTNSTRDSVLTKLDQFHLTIDNFHTATRRLGNILSTLTNPLAEDTSILAFRDTTLYLRAKISEFALIITTTKNRIVSATDSLLNTPSTGETGITEVDRLREENEILRHRLHEVNTTNQSHIEKLVLLETAIQEKEEQEAQKVKINLDTFFIVLRRIEEQAFLLSWVTSAESQEDIDFATKNQKVILQQLTDEIENQDTIQGDWVRFQFDNNFFPIGQVEELKSDDKLTIKYQSYSIERKKHQILKKSDYSLASPSSHHREIRLNTTHPLYLGYPGNQP